jgi:hypothetical protein
VTREHVVELVEQAVRDEPHCPACGSPTMVVTEGQGIRLECASLAHRRSLLQGSGARDRPHTQRQLLDPEDLAAA